MDLLRHMRSFVTVVREGSMNAAAAHLGVSSVMVGQHIAALEDRLGMRLLNRTTRRQSLTDFGANYLEKCHEILELVALTEKHAEVLQDNVRGMLRITAPVIFGTEMLVPE